ncbi:hypothetical protein H696_02442 [Fonticula alba]|uniref:Uncharacterized protein n=1 Tax=Fonticula alba TaxID=691883 RepID=A0A058ZC41_FONAL|nr:hypothetical protein H696_02442 [Fonticula alba]KCV71498.1 hypothetical protein H696_02442 [Fonticula alba]|eukprot:XP_009494621.1 hypothetical protein H696_02442 [Fonticula alba]
MDGPEGQVDRAIRAIRSAATLPEFLRAIQTAGALLQPPVDQQTHFRLLRAVHQAMDRRRFVNDMLVPPGSREAERRFDPEATGQDVRRLALSLLAEMAAHPKLTSAEVYLSPLPEVSLVLVQLTEEAPAARAAGPDELHTWAASVEDALTFLLAATEVPGGLLRRELAQLPDLALLLLRGLCKLGAALAVATAASSESSPEPDLASFLPVVFKLVAGLVAGDTEDQAALTTQRHAARALSRHLLPGLAQLLDARADARRFEGLALLRDFLLCLPADLLEALVRPVPSGGQGASGPRPADWLQSIRGILRGIVLSRVPDDKRLDALSLLAILLAACGLGLLTGEGLLREFIVDRNADLMILQDPFVKRRNVTMHFRASTFNLFRYECERALRILGDDSPEALQKVKYLPFERSCSTQPIATSFRLARLLLDTTAEANQPTPSVTINPSMREWKFSPPRSAILQNLRRSRERINLQAFEKSRLSPLN